MSAAVRWQRQPDVLWRHSGDVVLLKLPDCPDIVTLDSSGLALWNALAEPTTLSEAAGRIAQEYDASAATVMEGLAPVLGDLERLRLVRRAA